MPRLIVASPTALVFEGRQYRCAIGKGGFSSHKTEGDGATPVGEFALRECWYRADRVQKPDTGLKLRVIEENDGWCDDPTHVAYNRHIKLPFTASHEKLWREEHVYDLVVPIGYNDAPVLAGKGSAIFMHIAKPDYAPTEGCVALAREDLLSVLAFLNPHTCIRLGAP